MSRPPHDPPTSRRPRPDPGPAAPRRRPGPFTLPFPPRGGAGRTLLALGVALVLTGCSGDAGQAQGQEEATGADNVVPSDRSVVVERADRARVKGDTGAPVRILEVSDFECPYCKQFYDETFPGVDSLYVRTGQVEYVWLAYPNPSHRLAYPAIEAAYCAGAVGRFWPMHDLLFERQGEWTQAQDLVDVFAGYAEELGIDAASFRNCLVEDLPSGLVARDYGAASRGGVSGTPFFMIGDSTAIQGAQPLSRFREALDGLLEGRGGG